MSEQHGQRPRRRLAAAVLAAAASGLVGISVVAAQDGMTYYRTPTEARAAQDGQAVVRLGGLVVPGSLEESAEVSTMVLTDGATDVTVRYPGILPAVVREGEGAVVEGRLDARGVMHAEELLLRHSNEYRAPEDASP